MDAEEDWKPVKLFKDRSDVVFWSCANDMFCQNLDQLQTG